MQSTSPFSFIAGHRALCFVDTFGDRGGVGVERLATPHDLFTWLDDAGLATTALRVPTIASLLRTRALREAIFRCASAIVDQRPAHAGDIDLLNATVAKPPARPRLVQGALTMHAAHPLAAALSTVADEAIHLFTGSLRDRIRRCPECRMVFLDTSPPGKRRWCSSASGCGNRAKVRRHRLLGSRGETP